MSTVLDIVTRSLRDLHVLQGNEDPDSEDAQTCLEQLNDMLYEWASSGVDILHQGFVLTDQFAFFVPPAAADSDTITALSYRGTWDAGTNTPTLTSASGTDGYVYKVATAGSTVLDSVTSWAVGDFALFSGDAWVKGTSSRRFDGGVAAMLSLRISSEFGKAPSEAVVMRANAAWSLIQAAFIKPPLAGFDTALTRTPSRGLWEGL